MTVYRLDDRGVVRIERRFDTDAADLWSALTDPERLARWIVEVKGELRLAGEFRAKFTSGWEGPGRVDVCEPPSRLLVTMAPAEADSTVIEATVSADGDGCRLLVEERGLPLTEAWAHGAGWQAHIEDLAEHLEGRPAGDWHARWKELSPSYRERYGILR